jgi:hypothetical protein
MMSEALRQMIVGLSAVFFAPTGSLPAPSLSITLPPDSAQQGIGFDFRHVAKDLNRAIDQIENREQMEMDFTRERAEA